MYFTAVSSFLRNANKTHCQVPREVFRHKGLTAININHPGKSTFINIQNMIGKRSCQNWLLC